MLGKRSKKTDTDSKMSLKPAVVYINKSWSIDGSKITVESDTCGNTGKKKITITNYDSSVSMLIKRVELTVTEAALLIEILQKAI